MSAYVPTTKQLNDNTARTGPRIVWWVTVKKSLNCLTFTWHISLDSGGHVALIIKECCLLFIWKRLRPIHPFLSLLFFFFFQKTWRSAAHKSQLQNAVFLTENWLEPTSRSQMKHVAFSVPWAVYCIDGGTIIIIKVTSIFIWGRCARGHTQPFSMPSFRFKKLVEVDVYTWEWLK